MTRLRMASVIGVSAILSLMPVGSGYSAPLDTQIQAPAPPAETSWRAAAKPGRPWIVTMAHLHSTVATTWMLKPDLGCRESVFRGLISI
jgi:hypothetical protein